MDKSNPETIQQQPRAGATRCPFCHDECVAGQDACACADCLSRHHTACWEEASGCSSCRSANRLSATSSSDEVEVAAKSDPRYGEVLDAWLKLALVYNGGLGLVTLLILGSMLLTWRVAILTGEGAFVANLCFLLGPVSELIARRAGFRKTKPLRWTLFVLGFGFSLLLALAACASLYWGPMD